MARKRGEIPLKNAVDVRRHLANLVNRLERDEIDPKKASKIGYLSNFLLRAIETEAIERRLDELEKGVDRGVLLNVSPAKLQLPGGK